MSPTPHPPVPPQVPSGIILQNKAVGAPATPQTSTSLGPLTSPTASVLVSGQAPSGTPTAPSHAPTPAPMATTGLPPLLPAENKAFASNLPSLNVAKAASSGPGKPSGLQVRGPRSGGQDRTKSLRGTGNRGRQGKGCREDGDRGKLGPADRGSWDTTNSCAGLGRADDTQMGGQR
ncbi:hypothetical protein P7K49_034712 [Saguinus oedipus]|uniref:Uncharacterized protein n=1 Tax=Saguinus oedipus TaxID=9490 RepID=A0ABQ9TVH3_SAGOE|nr:hypothetical protein P7K49_034712 [Saguinus oedipus]